MSVIGIDVGALNSVLATVQRGTVVVVRTELADRLTPSVVLFTNNQRYMGDQAIPLVRSNLKGTCRYFKNMVGDAVDDFAEHPESLYALDNMDVTENGFIGFSVPTSAGKLVMSAARVMAAYITKLQHIAEASLNRRVSEVVISCPGWYNDFNRIALNQAAEIAGLKCLRIVKEMSALVLDYGLFRRKDFEEKNPTHVAFVDVGHSTSSVCIASFFTSYVDIKAHECNRRLGGRDMDYIIINYFVDQFIKTYKLNPIENLKARLKLEEQAEKVKKVISANSETNFHIECLLDGNDCSGIFSRDTFEKLCSRVIENKFRGLLESSVLQCGLNVQDIKSVEITGGCTRIPWVQKCIKDVFKRELSRTLSADETIARGCALQAAMLSTHYKVKEYYIIEKVEQSIIVAWSNWGNFVSAEVCDNSLPREQLVWEPVPKNMLEGSKLCIKRGTLISATYVLTFMINSNFSLVACYESQKTSAAAELNYERLCTADVSVKSISSEMSEIQVFCFFDANGVFNFGKACQKQTREVERRVPKNIEAPHSATDNGDKPSQTTAEVGEAGMDNAPPEGSATEPEIIIKKFQETHWVDIPISCKRQLDVTHLLSQFRRAERDMDLADIEQQNRQNKMNEFEAYIYSLRDMMHGRLKDFINPSEKDALLKALDDGENWIYSVQGGEPVSIDVTKEKMGTVEALFASAFTRESQYIHRGAAAEKALDCIREAKNMCQGQDPQYMHVLPKQRNELFEACTEAEQWINKVMTQHRAVPLYKDSDYEEDIEGKGNEIASWARKLFCVSRPKTPTNQKAGSAMDVEMSEGSQDNHGDFDQQQQEQADGKNPTGDASM